MRYSVSVLGPLSGRLTSFLGGVKFNKNGVVTAFTNPHQPGSPTQTQVKAAFTFLTSAWTLTLSDAQRLAWKNARDNDSYYLTNDALNGTSRKYGSAKDLFVAMNLNFLAASGTLGTPAVTYTTPGTSTGIDSVTVATNGYVLDASSGTAVLTYTGSFTKMRGILKATPPLPAGTMIRPDSKLRIVTPSPGASPVSTGAAYTGLFGVITTATGKKVFWVVEGVDILTGKSTVLASGSSIVQA